MPRYFECGFANVGVTLAQDLFSIQATSGMAFELMEIALSQVTQTTVESLRMSIKRFSGAYTIGSGGSSVTPQKHNDSDNAATCTVRANDTTQTSGGTSVIIRPDVFNLINGYQYLALSQEGAPIIIKPNQALIVSLDQAPAASRTMQGSILFREVF